MRESRFSLGHVEPSKHPEIPNRSVWVYVSLEKSSSQDRALGAQCLQVGKRKGESKVLGAK